MYVAVKGGEKAINTSLALLNKQRRGDANVAELELAQIEQQLSLSVDRVMAEGSLYDRFLAALAIKQARGDLVEAIFLLRAYRTTLPRFGISKALETDQMQLQRRISATFKDLPGGQILGASFDYSQRLLDFTLATAKEAADPPISCQALDDNLPRVTDLLDQEGLIEPETQADSEQIFDITEQARQLPASRDQRLQNLARADEGFLLALAYSTQRGYGRNHPFAGEIRYGLVRVSMIPEELGFEIDIGCIEITECQMINQFAGNDKKPPQFTRGYGLSFGYNERKTMAMALLDRALRARELGEAIEAPAQDEEFVLYHSDNVEAMGFVQHLKLPHYVDFQSELNMLRQLRKSHAAGPRKMDSNT